MTRWFLLLALLTLLIAPAAARASNTAALVSIRATAGYDGYYRESAWMPVRVSIRNLTPSTIDGTVVAQGAADAPRAAQYSEHVVLPAGADKRVTLYIPGTDAQGTVNVEYRTGTSLLATAGAYPNAFDDTDFIVGAFSDDPVSVSWLRKLRPRLSRSYVISLSEASLDTSYLALSTFDAILLTNADSSLLDAAQTGALEQYVKNGGTLILIGGPNWQETLSSLPAALVPGHLTGTQTISGLDGLRSLGHGTPPRYTLAATRLSRPRGAILAAEKGIPLVVSAVLGDGQLEYLAFDPSDTAFERWAASGPLLTALVAGAAPLSMRRAGLLPVDRATSFLAPGPEAVGLSDELSNISTPPLTTLLAIPFIVLITAILGIAAAVFILRRWRRRRAALISIPALAALCVAVALNAAPLVRTTAVVNTINVVFMGRGDVHPADRYVGLLSPLSGDYTLTYGSPAAVSDIFPARAFEFGSVGPAPATFDEGPRTTISLPDVRTWTTRAVALHTTMRIPGTINADLHLDAAGDVVGTVTNRTSLALQRPAIIAGQTFVRLPDIRPSSRVRVRLRPRDDVHEHDYPQMLHRVYGETIPDYAAMASQRTFSLPGSPAGIPPDRNLDQRIRNAVSTLPETHLLTSIGEITLVAWSDRPLDPVTVDGAAVSHRDLSLLIQPLTVTLPHGRFMMPTGVEGARAVQVDPAPPQYPLGGYTIQPIALGPGASATFAFTLPKAGYRDLEIDLYAGGADTSETGYAGVPYGAASVYDWGARRWVPLRFIAGTSRLVNPVRFISYTGSVLLRLQSTEHSGYLAILDPRQDMQLHGAGAA